jgi:hypothetical protein
MMLLLKEVSRLTLLGYFFALCVLLGSLLLVAAILHLVLRLRLRKHASAFQRQVP